MVVGKVNNLFDHEGTATIQLSDAATLLFVSLPFAAVFFIFCPRRWTRWLLQSLPFCLLVVRLRQSLFLATPTGKASSQRTVWCHRQLPHTRPPPSLLLHRASLFLCLRRRLRHLLTPSIPLTEMKTATTTKLRLSW